MEGQSRVFECGGWAMWCARNARVVEFGPQGLPVPFARWGVRGRGRDVDGVRSTQGATSAAGPAGGAPTGASASVTGA